jgi:hypothetical protein
MKFAFFRPNDLEEAVRVGTASRGVREKNAKVAVLRRSYYYYAKTTSLVIDIILLNHKVF